MGFEVAEPVSVGGVVVIPKGSLAWGGIQEFKGGGGRTRGRGKEVKSDVEAVRLPDLRVLKLRTSREHKDYDVIKVSSDFGSGVGAPKGTTYTVYLDEDFQTPGSAAPATATTTPPAPSPAASQPPSKPSVSPATPVAPPPAVSSQPARPAESVTAQTAAKQTPPPAVAQPTHPAVAQPAQPARAPDMTFGPSTEWITVECFSTPAGSEILIGGVYYGNTQSIIRVSAGNHLLQFKLDGYKPYTVQLDIPAGSPVRTIRKDMESLNPQ